MKLKSSIYVKYLYDAIHTFKFTMLQKNSEYLLFQNFYSMIKLSCYNIRIYEFVEYVLCM